MNHFGNLCLLQQQSSRGINHLHHLVHQAHRIALPAQRCGLMEAPPLQVVLPAVAELPEAKLIVFEHREPSSRARTAKGAVLLQVIIVLFRRAGALLPRTVGNLGCVVKNAAKALHHARVATHKLR